MAVTGIERNYNAYESAYGMQKNEAAKKAETKEQSALQTGNATKQTASDYNSYSTNYTFDFPHFTRFPKPFISENQLFSLVFALTGLKQGKIF